ncbi:MAG TPA: ATP-binding protein [Thermoleophilaceae bacterium]
MTERQSFSLKRDPRSVREARGALDGLGDRLPPGRLYDATLCLSELVTNAIQHPDQDHGSALEVSLVLCADVLRVEVVDPGHGFDRAAPRKSDEGGWGLQLVERLATRWGIESGRGNTVWFEIAREERSAAGAEEAGEGTPGERTSSGGGDERLRLAESLRLRSRLAGP